MLLTIDDISAISKSVASEFGDAVQSVAVASNQADSGRIELLLTVDGRDEPVRVLLNIARSDRSAFERSFREHLQDALRASKA
jgi:hypothetical protein